MRNEGRHRRIRTTGAGLGVVAVAALAAIGGLAAAKAPAQPAHHGGAPSISGPVFIGTAFDSYANANEKVYEYTLSSGNGVKIGLMTFGAITQYVDVPSRSGKEADVVLGFKNLTDYINEDSPATGGGVYFGETIGRYGNRIAKGTFQLKQPDGTTHTYTVPINNNGNSLHGGLVGFGNHVWASKGTFNKNGQAGVTLELVSPNGDQGYTAAQQPTACPSGCTGYPAQITTDVTFSINAAGDYTIHYKVHNDSDGTNGKPKLNTVVNLTNHSYFNLAGESSGTAAYQPITINADKYTPTNSTQIPLGTEPSVKGTPFDFTHPRTIASGIEDCTQPSSQACQQLLIAQGYDHNWVLNHQTKATTGPDNLNLAAVAYDPGSGRKLTVWTDQPGVQFYTSNFLTGTLVGSSGHIYRQTQASTFETQHFPDSPNQPQFPSTELLAGQTLNTTTVFAFSS